MKIKILKTITGAPDHLNSRDYQPGEEFEVGHPDMPQFLAHTLLEEGFAEEVGAKRVEKEVEKPVEKEVVKPAKPAGYPKNYSKKA